MKLSDSDFDKTMFIKSLESIVYLFLVLPLVAFGWVFLEKEKVGGLRATFFENTDEYLTPSFSLAMLSEKLEIPRHHLSEIINLKKSNRFNKSLPQ